MKEGDCLHQRAWKTATKEDQKVFRELLNRLKVGLQEAEQEYYNHEIHENKNNCGAIWKTICSTLQTRHVVQASPKKVNGVFSDWLPVYCGVSQGSLLGPLLFNVFINHLNFSVQLSSLRLYADDSTGYASNTDISALELSLNKDLENLSSWFASNYLSINSKKNPSYDPG